MINLAKGAQREVEDIILSRYACYLIVQNGEPITTVSTIKLPDDYRHTIK